MSAGLLGFTFGFGAKDQGLGKAMKSSIRDATRLQTIFSGLSTISLSKISSQLERLSGSGMGRFTTASMAFAAQAATSINPVMARIGLVGKELAAARAKITSTAYGLNIDASTVANSMAAIVNAGDGASKSLRLLGLDLAGLSKLEQSTGIAASDMGDTLRFMNKVMSPEAAAALVDEMTALSVRNKLNAAGLKNIADLQKTLNEQMQKSPDLMRMSGAEIGRYLVGAQELSVVLREIGGLSSEDAAEGGKTLLTALTQARADLKNLGLGGGEFGELAVTLSELSGRTGIKGGVQALLGMDPAEFTKTVLESLDRIGDPRMRDRMAMLLSPVNAGMAQLIRAGSSASNALGRVMGSAKGASKELDKVNRAGYASGLTLDDWISRMEDAFETRLTMMAMRGIKAYVKTRKQALGDLSSWLKTTVDRDRGQTFWGGIVQKMLEVRKIGLGALFPASAMGEAMWQGVQMMSEVGKTLAPILVTFKMLGPVISTILAPVGALFAGLRAVIELPFDVLGAALGGVGGLLEKVGDGLIWMGEATAGLTGSLQKLTDGVGDLAAGIPIVGSLWKGVWTIFGAGIGIVGGLTSSLLKLAGVGIKSTGQLVKWIGSKMPAMGKMVSGITDTTLKGIAATGGALAILFSGKGPNFSQLKKDFDTTLNVVKQGLWSFGTWLDENVDAAGFAQKIVDSFRGIPSAMEEVTKDPKTGMLNVTFAQSIFKAGGAVFKIVGDFFGTLFEGLGGWPAVKDAARGFLSDVLESPLVNAMKNGFIAFVDWIKTEGGNLISGALGGVVGRGGSVWGGGGGAGSGSTSGSGGSVGSAVSSVGGAIGGIVGQVRDVTSHWRSRSEKGFLGKLADIREVNSKGDSMLRDWEPSLSMNRNHQRENVELAEQQRRLSIALSSADYGAGRQGRSSIGILGQRIDKRFAESVSLAQRDVSAAMSGAGADPASRAAAIAASYEKIASLGLEGKAAFGRGYVLAGQPFVPGSDSESYASRLKSVVDETDLAMLEVAIRDALFDLGSTALDTVPNELFDRLTSGWAPVDKSKIGEAKEIAWQGVGTILSEAMNAASAVAAGNGVASSFSDGLSKGIETAGPLIEKSLEKSIASPMMAQSDPKTGPLRGMTESGFTLATMFGAGMDQGLAVQGMILNARLAIMGISAVDAFTTAARARQAIALPELTEKLRADTVRMLAGVDAPDMKARVDMVAEATGIPDVVRAIVVEGAKTQAILSRIEKNTAGSGGVSPGAGGSQGARNRP